jgi:hypothetical protein
MNPTILKTFGPKFYSNNDEQFKIVATVRYDDQCHNGHNSFSITGSQWRTVSRYYNYRYRAQWIEDTCGCIHELIAEHFPELEPFLKWHGMTEKGPVHYIANTLYLAGDRDHWGLRKGETRQIRNGKTGLQCWQLVAKDEQGNLIPTYKLPRYEDGEAPPTSRFTLEWQPWLKIGEGKPRELDLARKSAIWPEATDDELTAPDLKTRLELRLPALIADFEKDLEQIRAMEGGQA